ncbi:MAG: NAD(P)-dependent oxidoreductase [Clostridia bacterium]|nr:NAD(P)-dependent oxidoreductase [Clostridia bacterium]
MNIGFVGLGIMGEAMCANIIKKHEGKVYVFDFVKEKVDALAALGAIPCASTREVAEKADLFFSMVPKSDHSRAVYEEALPALGPGKVCIDMSTIDPKVSVEIAEAVKATGAQFADAPVVKSRPAAIAGELGILVGCEEDLFSQIAPVLSYMGQNIIRMGGNGSGLVMKICHNALVSQIQNGVNETLTLAEQYGIGIDDFVTAVSYGGAQNFYLDSKKEALKTEDWSTAFSVQNMHKDVHICLEMAKEKGLPMPGEQNAAKVYDRALEQGLGGEDFCATMKVVREGGGTGHA